MIIDGNEVNEEGSSTHHCRNKKSSNEHLLYPSPSCKKEHANGIGNFLNKIPASSSEFRCLFPLPQKIKKRKSNNTQGYKSQDLTNSFIWLLETSKMQHINQFIRPGEKTRERDSVITFWLGAYAD